MKRKIDADGYESGGPLMWGWRADGVLPGPEMFRVKNSVQRTTVELDSDHMAILEREASRHHKPMSQFMSGILSAQAEALR